MNNKAVGTVVGGQFHYLSVNHGLADGSGLYARAQVIVPDAPTQCRHCSSDDLSWEACNTVSNGIQNGLLRTTDVQCLFVLGCNECSETLLRVDADRIAGLLLATPAPSTQGVGPGPYLNEADAAGNPLWKRLRSIANWMVELDPENHMEAAEVLLAASAILQPHATTNWPNVANEYADAAANALDGLKCIRDGLSTVEQVIESQQRNIERIQKLHHTGAGQEAS